MNQHVRSPPSSPRPSARAAPDVPEGTLTFQWERLPAIARELSPLIRRHYEESVVDHGKIPFEINWDRYFDLALLNILHVLTARSGRAIVGYAMWLFTSGLDTASTADAQLIKIWLDPLYREGLAGYRLLREGVSGMKKVGAQRFHVGEKEHYSRDRGGLSILFKRLGFRPDERIWIRVDLTDG